MVGKRLSCLIKILQPLIITLHTIHLVAFPRRCLGEEDEMHLKIHFYSGFRRKARVLKCKPFLVAKRGVMVPGVPCVNRGN